MKKFILYITSFFWVYSCNTSSESDTKNLIPNDVIPFFEEWNLILGDGTNSGQAIAYEHPSYFKTSSDESGNWIVFKTPNGGNTHGTSNNTRTELAQLKKWLPTSEARMKATLKVTNVSSTGDPSVPASYSVVVGQIHSADGHENEPLKIFYKKFPGHNKGSVFWNYEINTDGDDNSKRWDVSFPVWGYDFSVVGDTEIPPEPSEGIEIGEEFSYDISVKNGIMTITFSSENHPTKTYQKNLIESDYSTPEKVPLQVKSIFFPIGQNGTERKNAYTDEGLFFKLGSYNQTNGKDPKINRVWCSGAETYGGDLQKQYDSGNFAEVWLRDASIEIPEDALSNQGYFESNDGLSNKTVYPSEVISDINQFKILLGDGTRVRDLDNFEHKDFFYTAIDGTRRWVVYKTPNSGVTSPNSSNTRTELHQKKEWTPEEGGFLKGVCKVMQVSSSGDPSVAASYSVVVGQIHGGEGHENEPLKIFYKKFPNHEKGSIFWNYEINTDGDDNSKRWDVSFPVWGHDMSVTGKTPFDFPKEPEDGVRLGEEFTYEVNVFDGVMYLNFSSPNHQEKSFKIDLTQSQFTNINSIPKQVKKLFFPLNQNGIERSNAYSGERMYFKQGAYNQTNGKMPSLNNVWFSGAEVYGGDIEKQYSNGSYAEVWFREMIVGPGKPLKH
jgi:hypothetical protein